MYVKFELLLFQSIKVIIIFYSQLAIAQPWRFSGDGVLSFNPLLRPIQLPWLNALSIRTRQHDTFLMSVQVGQNSSAIISVSIYLFIIIKIKF